MTFPAEFSMIDLSAKLAEKYEAYAGDQGAGTETYTTNEKESRWQLR